MNHKFLSLLLLIIGIVGVITFSPTSAQSTLRYAYITQENLGEIRITKLNPDDLASIPETRTVSLPDNGQVTRATLSPNGKWITLALRTNSETATFSQPLLLVSTETAETRSIPAELVFTHDEPVYPQQRVVWSPDSRYLAFISYQSDKSDIYIYDVQHDSQINLTSDHAVKIRIAWSNDSAHVGIASEDCSSQGLCALVIRVYGVSNWSLEADINVSELPSPKYEDALCQLDWSPTGRYISFVTSCDLSDIGAIKEVYAWDIVQGTTVQVTNYTIDTGVPENSPFLRRYGAYDPIWSDNQTLLVGGAFAVQGNDSRIVQTIAYDFSTNTSATILNGEMGRGWTLNPVSGELGFQTSVTYSKFQDAFIRIAAWNGNAFNVLLSATAGCDLRWSPDGRFLAATSRGLPLDDCQDKIQGFRFIDRITGKENGFAVSSEGRIFAVGWVKG